MSTACSRSYLYSFATMQYANRYTSVSLLRYAERGAIDLDEPVYKILDPWAAKQSPKQPTLLELFDDNKVVNTITTRQLMQMRGGIQDYDDETMFNRTVAAPDKDLLPMDFLSTMNTTLMFPPGTADGTDGTDGTDSLLSGILARRLA